MTNPTVVGFDFDEAPLRAALAPAGSGTYEPTPLGIAGARAAAAATFPAPGVTAERVVLSASTSEAYSWLLHLLCDAGDEVLVPSPSYPLLEELARLAGVELTPYRLAYDGAWHVDLPSLEAAVTPRSRAVVVVSPNHPTGSCLRREELRRVAALGLPIVADEVFAAYAYADDPTRAATALEAEGALVFALGGLSKFALLPQLKLAWMGVGGPDALAREALHRLELVADTFLSVATPVQLALPRLLELAGPRRAAARARCVGGRRALAQALAGTPATLLHAEGGWAAIVRLPATRPDTEWAALLLRDHGVLVHPGRLYDLPTAAPTVVVSLIVHPGDLAVGARAIGLASSA
ncbi:MAG: pyridoxal phosphate-dependent aminotransferase [Polyangiaceae bacterium]|nr:pyridoxal phosphate-dependent aminotransferase [Polyangiaceae bacterium]